MLGGPITLNHVTGDLRTPESMVQTIAWDQRFERRFFVKAAYLHRNGSHSYIVNPDAGAGTLTLASGGKAKYWEFETTGRYLASENRDVTVSYVRSHSTTDLNDFDQYYGNFRNPIIRANEHSLSQTDVPNRLIVRGTLGLPGKWVDAVVRMAHRISVVGGRRVSGLRRGAQSGRASAEREIARLHAGAAVAGAEIPLRRWHQDLQRLRRGQRAGRAEQHRLTRLRQVLQPDSTVDWLRGVVEQVVSDRADRNRLGVTRTCQRLKPHHTKRDGRRIPPAVLWRSPLLTYLARVAGFTRVALTVRASHLRSCRLQRSLVEADRTVDGTIRSILPRAW